MNWLGLLAVVAAAALLVVARRSAEYDRAGNPALRLRPPATALLPIALYVVAEGLAYRAGESHRLHPHTFYALMALGGALLVLSAALFSFTITVEPRTVVQSFPFLWRRTISLHRLVEIQEDPLIPIVRFSGGGQITVLPLYSGVGGFLEHLRAFHAELSPRSED